MPKEEIVEGLKVALSKGESLEKAMMSFFNAGYSKEDVEEAAGFLQAPHISQPSFSSPMVSPAPTPTTLQAKTPSKLVYYQPGQAEEQRVVQRVSNYGGKPSKAGTIITIILVVLLIILIGILAAVFLFKQEIADFFSRTVGLVIQNF